MKVLFLHGFMGESSDWDEIIGFFPPNFKCLAMDLPGHGEKKDLHFLDSMALINYFQKEIQRHSPLSIVGHSLGGRIALQLALLAPALFTHLILLGAGVGLKEEEARQARSKADSELFKDFSAQTFYPKWFSQDIFASLCLDPKFESLLKKRMNSPWQSHRESLKYLGLGVWPYLGEQVKDLKVPTLYLTGEKDTKYREIALSFFSKNPLITVKEIKNCGHNFYFEDPKATAKLIVDFLNQGATS